MSKGKDLERRYFALIRLKTDSALSLALQNMHSMPYTQTLFFSEKCSLDGRWILKCIVH